MIQEAYFEDGHFHYEHIYGREHHCHLRCINCGKIIEFTEESVDELDSKLCKKYDFAIKGYKLEVFGYCPECKAHT